MSLFADLQNFGFDLRISGLIRCCLYLQLSNFACSANGRFSPSRVDHVLSDYFNTSHEIKMSTQIRNWQVVLKKMESAGATSSQMYLRARALEDGKLDPMPTSMPRAPFSISAVAG